MPNNWIAVKYKMPLVYNAGLYFIILYIYVNKFVVQGHSIINIYLFFVLLGRLAQTSASGANVGCTAIQKAPIICFMQQSPSIWTDDVYLLGSTSTPGRLSTGRATSRTSPTSTGSSSGVTMQPLIAASVMPVRSTHSLMFLLSWPMK